MGWQTREPFDQFSRQYYINRLVNGVVRKNDNNLSIVDLGGHKGNTARLFPEDEVTVLDVFDETYPGYVKGDATNAPFSDNQFDLSTSFDVLEHIPRQKRQKFILESVRVAKIGTFIAAPFDDELGYVAEAEQAANALYKRINGKDHQWLKEHIDYGIPVRSTIEEIITGCGLYFCRLGSNPLANWLSMQSMIFMGTALERDVKAVVDVNEYYNKHIEKLESINADCYRSIYFVTNKKATLEQVNKNMCSAFAHISLDPLQQVMLSTKINNAIADIMLELRDDRAYLLRKVAALEEEVAHAVHALEAANTHQ